MPKYIEVPSDEPTPPGCKELPKPKTLEVAPGVKCSTNGVPPQIGVPETIPDQSYVGAAVAAVDEAVNKPMTSGAKLLDKYGVGVFLMVVFTGILVTSLYYARSDANAKDTMTRESHERALKNVVDTFSSTVNLMREDHREERTRQDVHQAKMYEGMRSIRDSNMEQARSTQELLQEFRKIANRMP